MTAIGVFSLIAIAGNLVIASVYAMKRNWSAALGWFLAFYLSVALFGHQK